MSIGLEIADVVGATLAVGSAAAAAPTLLTLYVASAMVVGSFDNSSCLEQRQTNPNKTQDIVRERRLEEEDP